MFIFFLGRFSPDEINLGIFGLVVTSITLLIYLIGFDFYVFNTRQIINNHRKGLSNKISNQLYFHLVGYLLIIPLSTYILVELEVIPATYLWVFIFLVVAEHLGQEYYRLFTALEKSVLANILLFLRSGVWVLVVFLDYFVFGNPINLNKYMGIWLCFSSISTLTSTILLVLKYKIHFATIELGWILKGIKTASVFFLGSISFQVIQFSDRFIVDFFHGKKMVGVYTTYAQFTNAIEIFTFSAITMVAYPKMIKTYEQNKEYLQVKSSFFRQLLWLSLFLIVLMLVSAPYVLRFLEKESIIEEINTFFVLLAGIFFLIISNVYHYDLYVKKKDRIILNTALLGMLLNVVLNIVLIPKFSIFGASISTGLTFLLILLIKYYYSKKTNGL